LLLLAAVFTVHGLQCAAADSGAPSDGHGGVVHAVVGAQPVHHLLGPGAAMASTDHASASPLTATVTPAVSVPSGAGHGSSPHGAGHLWAWCLAVLAVGLSALLLTLVGRLPSLRPPLPRRITGNPWAWLSPLRPPDLHSLCLMRI
jgi:hypothetical protein